jgi:hypothetical protein
MSVGESGGAGGATHHRRDPSRIRCSGDIRQEDVDRGHHAVDA